MNALAIDTATESLGICLEAGEQRRTTVTEAGLKHSETLLPAVRRLLGDAGIAARELDLVVCCLGPGSFTGIRIGLATAKGLCFGSGIPLVGVANLDALAYRFRDFAGAVVPVLAGLRRHFYAAVYQGGRRISGYLGMSLEALTATLQDYPRVLLTGRAAGVAHDALASGISAGGLPEVSVDRGAAATDPLGLLKLGQLQLAEHGVPTQEPQPLYLRRSDAEISRFGE